MTWIFGVSELVGGLIGTFVFLGFFFLLLGGFGTPWVGGLRRGFRKYLTFKAFWRFWWDSKAVNGGVV